MREERAATAAKVSSRGTYEYLWIYYLGTEREKQEKIRTIPHFRKVAQNLLRHHMSNLGAEISKCGKRINHSDTR
jgi:hypothetical protein